LKAENHRLREQVHYYESMIFPAAHGVPHPGLPQESHTKLSDEERARLRPINNRKLTKSEAVAHLTKLHRVEARKRAAKSSVTESNEDRVEVG